MSETSAPQTEAQSSTRSDTLLATLGASTLFAMGSVLALILSEEGDWKGEMKKHEEMSGKIPTLVAHVSDGNREQMGRVLRAATRNSSWNEVGMRLRVAAAFDDRGLLPAGDRLLQHMYHDKDYPKQ